ncbi:MAG: ester cyclase [Thermoleophilia bacterium]|nr:ester cyclase [Thermoleophilia bacterium]
MREWMVKPLSPVIPARYEGRAAVVEGIAGFMGALPDIRVEGGDAWEIEGGAVLEWRVTGTHTADWDGWDAQGEAVDFPGCSVYRIEDGMIRRERMYWDTAQMVAGWRPPGA